MLFIVLTIWEFVRFDRTWACKSSIEGGNERETCGGVGDRNKTICIDF